MLFMENNPIFLCKSLLVLMFILFLCAGHAYRVNMRRAPDDPLKRDFHFSAILLAPITWPLFLFTYTSIFLTRVLVYVIFLILFTIALLAIRKPFLLIWLDKIASRLGNKLLGANTLLIKAFFGTTNKYPQIPR